MYLETYSQTCSSVRHEYRKLETFIVLVIEMWVESFCPIILEYYEVSTRSVTSVVFNNEPGGKFLRTGWYRCCWIWNDDNIFCCNCASGTECLCQWMILH